jgi:hypothetical protein
LAPNIYVPFIWNNEPSNVFYRPQARKMSYPKTEEELIGYTWLNLAGENWKEYAWAAPGTWAAIAILSERPERSYDDIKEKGEAGELGVYAWTKPQPFAVKILMNPFAEEGRIYLAHAGTEYFQYVRL